METKLSRSLAFCSHPKRQGRVRHGRNPDPELYLNQDEESSSGSFLITACKMGHEKTKQDFLCIVKRILEKNNPDKSMDDF